MGRAETAHVFSASYWSFWLAPVPAWLVAKMRGKSAVLHYHSGEAKDHLQRSPIARWALHRMSPRIVPSPYLRDVFSEFGLPVDVIPNLVDLSQFHYRSRNPVRPVLLCTRGCEPYYAVDDVVRAFTTVQRVYPEARLMLVGGGSLEPAIRALVRDLKVSNVEFCGQISREQIAAYYQQADVFVNASVLDNMPVSILEAFASGMPVVSTAPGGIRYLVEPEQTALVSAPQDWQALGANVLRILQDPALAARLAKNARSQVSQYSWEYVRSQWLSAYRAAAVHQKGHGAPLTAPVAQRSVTPETK
jgi:glycosyltransferase involved in cell wall biosynthesis